VVAGEANLEQEVRWTANHRGQFVIASGLTLADQQREFFFGVLRERFPDLLPLYERPFPAGSCGAVRSGDPHATGRRIRALCRQYVISDHMPRPIIRGDKPALSKRIVEAQANQVYYMELKGEASRRVWAYRRAAWAIEDLQHDVEVVYRQMGRKEPESLDSVGPRLATAIELLIDE
jgi:hypothetical protein